MLVLTEFYLQVKKKANGEDHDGRTVWFGGSVDPNTLEPLGAPGGGAQRRARGVVENVGMLKHIAWRS